MLYNKAVKMRRKLRRVGGSVMLPLPPEILHDSGLVEGNEVEITSRRGRVEIEPVAPELDPEFTTWLYELLERYDSAWRQLAEL
jgi:antitoxin component of MazEF toxin-antitoxin module